MHDVVPLHAAPSLVASDLVRSYGGERVLDGVSLARQEPGIVALLGANGSGKTTLLRIIAQLVEPDSGILQIAGQVVERADSPGARRSVGWAPHEPLAWRDDTVLQNLRYACRLAGMSRTNAAARASESVAAWNLDSVTDAAVRRLSRGWAQRYSLARADLLQPPVMLLDEPTTGLDSGARAMLEGALDRWRSTRIVIVASHEREWLFKRADQVLDLDLARVPVEKVDA